MIFTEYGAICPGLKVGRDLQLPYLGLSWRLTSDGGGRTIFPSPCWNKFSLIISFGNWYVVIDFRNFLAPSKPVQPLSLPLPETYSHQAVCLSNWSARCPDASRFKVLIFSLSFLELESTWPAFSGKKNMEAQQRKLIIKRARTNICFAWVLEFLFECWCRDKY